VATGKGKRIACEAWVFLFLFKQKLYAKTGYRQECWPQRGKPMTVLNAVGAAEDEHAFCFEAFLGAINEKIMSCVASRFC
jgi:hypothetical protein